MDMSISGSSSVSIVESGSMFGGPWTEEVEGSAILAGLNVSKGG